MSPQYDSPLRLTGFYYDSDVGLPGALQQATPNATCASHRLRVQSTWSGSVTNKLAIGTGLWFESASEHFVSPEKLTNDTEVGERFGGGRVSVTSPLGGFDSRLEAEARTRRLDGTDYLRPQLSFGVHDRTEFSLRTALRRRMTIGAHVVSASVSAAIEGDNLISPFYAPRVDVGCAMPFGLSVRSGWGKSFRRPLLTSLFWKSDAYAVGNPELEPERASEWDAGVGMRRGPLALDTRYFERRVADIIVWQRSTVTGQYKPLNVDESRIVGREDQATLSLGHDVFVLDYSHVFTGAYDRSSDVNYNGETLVLTPRHTHDVSIALTYARASLRANGRWVSLRYIRRQNNPEKALRPYRVFDLKARYAVRRNAPDVAVALGVDNLTNEYYELLERYPSPGRTWNATTTISF